MKFYHHVLCWHVSTMCCTLGSFQMIRSDRLFLLFLFVFPHCKLVKSVSLDLSIQCRFQVRKPALHLDIASWQLFSFLFALQDVPNALVSNCGPRFFSMLLPGSFMLIPDFISAAGTIISALDYKKVAIAFWSFSLSQTCMFVNARPYT